MAFSKSHRIITLLVIDSVFFLLEIVVGYSVHSLALVADSFHMLNDVLSLCVGLWAVKVANQTTNSKMYTYGWQRAETLGALVNGVFLVALCLSIFLEAIQRFVEPQEVSKPMLVLIVGCCGLASNILGLFLFHDHGHSHGSHSHGPSDHTHAAEEGENHNYSNEENDETAAAADEGGNIADVLPQSVVAGWSTSGKEPPSSRKNSEFRHSAGFTKSDEEVSTVAETNSQSSQYQSASPNNSGRRHRRHTSGSRSRFANASAEDIHVHPASFRNEIIAASRLEDIASSPTTESEDETVIGNGSTRPSEHSPLLGNKSRVSKGTHRGKNKAAQPLLEHSKHNHRQPKSDGGKSGGHSHGDLNMHGVFLHVLGDALGNIGVIASALIIWLTDYSWRFYSDPLISLIITVIILCSAIPLCRAASRILLQAVPAGLSVDDIKEDIEDLPGVVSCHHLHVWQLSDTKLVASLHIQVAFNYNGEDSTQYMKLAKAVRTCLHEYGIHSSTIQPEFCLDTRHEHAREAALPNGQGQSTSSGSSVRDACLLDCDDACGGGKGCCAPEPPREDEHGHDHDH